MKTFNPVAFVLSTFVVGILTFLGFVAALGADEGK
jgi:hypothetical protein